MKFGKCMREIGYNKKIIDKKDQLKRRKLNL